MVDGYGWSLNLKKTDIKRLFTNSGITVEQTMKNAKRDLVKIIKAKLNDVYSSYRPVKYVRTNRLKKIMNGASLTNYRIVGNQIQVTIPYNTAFASHPSISKKKKVDVASLVNYGIYNSSFYNRKPAYFFEQAIEEFNSGNPYGVVANVDLIEKDKNNWLIET